MLRYYRSHDRPEPTLYVQDSNRWQSLGPGGVTELGPDSIPEETMLVLSEIDP